MATHTAFQTACTGHFGACFERIDKRKVEDLALLSPDEAVKGVVVWYLDSFSDQVLKPAMLLADLEPNIKATAQIKVQSLSSGSEVSVFLGQTYISRGACKHQGMPSGFDEADIAKLQELASTNKNPAPLKKGEKKETTVAKTKTEPTPASTPVAVEAPAPEAKPKVTRGRKIAKVEEDDLPPIQAPAAAAAAAAAAEDDLPPMAAVAPGVQEGAEDDLPPIASNVQVVEEDHSTETVGDDLPPIQAAEPVHATDTTPEPGADTLDADDIKVLFELKLAGRRNSFKLQELLGVKNEPDGAKTVATLMGRLLELGVVDTEGEKRGKTYGITAAGLEYLEGCEAPVIETPVHEPKPKAEKKESKEKTSSTGKPIEIPNWAIRQLQEVVDQIHSIETTLNATLSQMKDGQMTSFPSDGLQASANALGVIQGGVLRLRFRGLAAESDAHTDPAFEYPKLEALRYIQEAQHALVAPEKSTAWAEVAKQGKLLAEKGKTMVGLLKTPGMDRLAQPGEPIRDSEGRRIDAGH